MLFSDWLCSGTLVVLLFVCLQNKAHGYYKNSSVIYVDCNNGSNVANCGSNWTNSCKTLQFVISDRAKQIKTSHAVINIASGECKESGVLHLDGVGMNISNWSFVGSNMTSNPTIVHFSMESFNSGITFSYLNWNNSNNTISFNIHMSKVAFQHCSFHHIKFQYTGLNTNLFIQDTVVTYCTSADTNLPLFFMQTLYNYNASIFIKNVEFSHNKSPIIYATQFEEIFMDGTSFVMNGKDISNLSLVTISGSYITLKHSTFNHTLGTAIEIKNAKNFTGSNIVFLSNNGSVGSCLVVKRHSNVNLLHTVFRQNSNPVFYVKDKDDVKILLQKCTFACIHHENNLPLLKAPEGTNITVTNCTAKSCLVHCKNGELVKSNMYCEKCQPGSFSYEETNIISGDSCQSCPVGTYSSSTGSMNCSQCGDGTYAQKSGSTTCKKCRNDFFTSDAGAESCSKMTLELILIVATTVPLIIIPLILLLSRVFKNKKLTLKARLQNGNNYERYDYNTTTTTNSVKRWFNSL